MAKATKAKTKATTTTKKVAKKPATVTKKTAPKKKAKAAAAAPAPFMQPRVTQESLYWLIFGAVAILFALWIYTLDARVRDLYDQIDANTYSTDAAIQVHMAEEKAKQNTQTTE